MNEKSVIKDKKSAV